MQKELEKVDFYQTKPYFFPYDKCDVIKVEKDNCTEYQCNEKVIFFESELFLKEDYVEIHITDIVITLTNSGIGKSVFAYLLSEAVCMCNDNKKDTIIISGFLSTADHIIGRWPNSLLAYGSLGKTFALDFYMTDMKTDSDYMKCPESLIRERYINIEDFFNPELGKINSGYLHYTGKKEEIKAALEKYYRYIQEEKNKIEDDKNRKYAEHQRLIQKGLDDYNKHSSIIDKIKKILNI